MTSKKWLIQRNFNVQKWKATSNNKLFLNQWFCYPGLAGEGPLPSPMMMMMMMILILILLLDSNIVSCSSQENSDMRRIYLLHHFFTINGMQLLVWKCLAPTNLKPPQSLGNKPPPLSSPYGPAARIWAKIKGERTWTILSWTRFIDFFFQKGWREPKAALRAMRPCLCKVIACYDQTLR